MDNPRATANGSPQNPDIPYLRRLMADALDAGQPVCIFPPSAADTLREELEIEPAEFGEGGFIRVAMDEADQTGPTALLIHFGHGEHQGEHLASDLITGSLTLTGREEGRS